MKKADINRLERAVKHYKEVQKALYAAYESIYDGDSEILPNKNLHQPTSDLVYDMFKEAKRNCEWIENRLPELKELVK